MSALQGLGWGNIPHLRLRDSLNTIRALEFISAPEVRRCRSA